MQLMVTRFKFHNLFTFGYVVVSNYCFPTYQLTCMLVCAEISIHKKEKNAAKENEITVNLLQFVFVKSLFKTTYNHGRWL